MDPALTGWVPDLLTKRKPGNPDERSRGTASAQRVVRDRLADEADAPDDVPSSPKRASVAHTDAPARDSASSNSGSSDSGSSAETAEP
ncbi:hypothetical protein ACGFOU_19190 [Streptomyces sp. NPDC048595]|uniref:hypothetical protein n=1 Tax=Streptomyces sp. NPDC048595 TaxID=3365576 RepID=UPI0037100138